MRVSVIIPAFGFCPVLERLIDALLSQTRKPDEIIVVHSGENDPGKLIKKDPIIRTIYRSKRLYPGASRNLGFRISSGELIAFIDSDAIPNKHWFSQMIDSWSQFKEVCVVGSIGATGKGGYWGLSLWLIEFGVVHPYLPCGYTKKYGTSCNMLLSRKMFEQIGGFAEDLLTTDDTELLSRLRKQDNKLYFNSAAIVKHYNVPGFSHFISHLWTLGKWGIINRSLGYGWGNSFLKGWKSFLLPWMWLIRLMKISYRIMVWGRGQRLQLSALLFGVLIGLVVWNLGIIAEIFRKGVVFPFSIPTNRPKTAKL